MRRAPPPEKGLGEPKRAFSETFSVVDCLRKWLNDLRAEKSAS